MKKLFTLFLLILLTSCNQEIASNSISSTTSSTSEEINNEQYWDVSNVDISHIDKENRLICFTFDDGPISNTAKELLDVFDNFNKKYASEGFQTTINAVKKLLPALYERGYQVVTIDEYCKVREIKLERHKVYTYLGNI